MLHQASIIAVISMTLFIGVRYCWLIVQRRIQPALAMWVFFTVAVAGSLATYLAEGPHHLTDNILNTADLALVGTVSLVIFLFGDRTTRFTRFDLGCTGAVLAILLFWAITRNHVVSHLAIQLILVIAYAPVVKRLWTARHNTESFAAWIGMMVAPVLSLLSSKGLLASVYAYRAIACTGLLLLLMWRVQRRGAATPRQAGATASGGPV